MKTISEIIEDSGMTQYVAPNNKYLERLTNGIFREIEGELKELMGNYESLRLASTDLVFKKECDAAEGVCKKMLEKIKEMKEV